MALSQANRQAVAAILREYPDTPYTHIAKRLGITTERVGQLARALNIPRTPLRIAPLEPVRD